MEVQQNNGALPAVAARRWAAAAAADLKGIESLKHRNQSRTDAPSCLSHPTTVDRPVGPSGATTESQLSGRRLRYIVSSARLHSLPPLQWSKDFLEKVRITGKKDPQYCEGLDAPANGESGGIITQVDGALYRQGWL